MSPAAPRAARPEWVVATGNAGKLSEIRAMLDSLAISLVSLAEAGDVSMPEEGDDYTENAIAKAVAASRATGLPALADDSGLEVDALGGRPGPHSARYGGDALDDAGRVALLLSELADAPGGARGARFVCVVALATPEGRVETAQGVCAGAILPAPSGAGGFGYDPVFQPRGEAVSMAELPAATKNRLSHRGRAFLSLRPAIEREVGIGATGERSR